MKRREREREGEREREREREKMKNCKMGRNKERILTFDGTL